MSSRRKSSTPCMVRAETDPPRPGGEGPGEEEEEPREEEQAEAGSVGGPLSSPDQIPEGGPSPREPEGAGPEAAEMDDDDDDEEDEGEEEEEEEGEEGARAREDTRRTFHFPPLERKIAPAAGDPSRYNFFK